MNRMFAVCWVLAVLAAGCLAFPSGAPDNVCNDERLAPTHHEASYGANATTNDGSYTLTAQPLQDGSNVIKVTLTGDTFKGFVVRAQTPGETNLGNFTVGTDTTPFKQLSCTLNQEYKAVTHTDPSPKTSVVLHWEDDNNGLYAFKATVVLDKFNHVIEIFN